MRRVLMILYYFPPSGGPGVQRGLKFVRYLSEFGWQPVVVTVRETASFPVRDETLLREIPAGLTVRRTRCPEFYDLYRALTGQRGITSLDITTMSAGERKPVRRLLRWLRAACFVPDGRIGWRPHAVRAGLQLRADPGYEAIFSSGPPFTSHLIGRELHRRTGIPWVADYRDPWTRAPFYPNRPGFARRLDERLEEACLAEAQRTVVVGEQMAAGLHEGHPQIPRERISVIPNGYDPADFEHVPILDDGTFRLTHTGSLFLARTPANLLAALETLLREEPGFAEHARLCLAGRTDADLIARVRGSALANIAELPGYLPHGESVAWLRRSRVLLLLIGRDAQAHTMVTGKVYEYLAAGAPILAIGPCDGDAAKLLARTRAGRIFEPDDAVGIREHLRELWRRFRAGEPLAAAPDAREIERYSRRELTRELARLLDGCVATDPPLVHSPGARPAHAPDRT
jgi:glycosyltransferase involved in cell wall biosynthesis